MNTSLAQVVNEQSLGVQVTSLLQPESSTNVLWGNEDVKDNLAAAHMAVVLLVQFMDPTRNTKPSANCSNATELAADVRPMNAESLDTSRQGTVDVIKREQLQHAVGAGITDTQETALTRSGRPIHIEKPDVNLCQEPKELIDLILSGSNVFYTGSAGVGKSVVLQSSISLLQAQTVRVQVKTEGKLKWITRNKRVDVIAPTGKAALDISSCTSWTYAGWIPDHMKRSLDELKMLSHQEVMHDRLAQTDVLVIDEASMMENHHLEHLSETLKETRYSYTPFGGAQAIIPGHFYQLPPVEPSHIASNVGILPTRVFITSTDTLAAAAHGQITRNGPFERPPERCANVPTWN
jgi:hypothetical protein